MVDKRREKGKAYNVSISLYENQINKIKKHVRKSNNFRTEAAFFQYMVDEYFKKVHGSRLRMFLSYAGYPIIITALMLYVAWVTSGLNSILVGKGFYFNELYIQQQIFFIIGFFWLSMSAASIWAYIAKRKKQ
jgi:hypothetical protein